METNIRRIPWQNGGIAQEYELLFFYYKGEKTCVHTGNHKWFYDDGTVKEECEYGLTTFHDRAGRPFLGHNRMTRKYYSLEGELVNSEVWVPEYFSPYDGPGSLQTFKLED